MTQQTYPLGKVFVTKGGRIQEEQQLLQRKIEKKLSGLERTGQTGRGRENGNPDTNAVEESDRLIVPEKGMNEAEAKLAETSEEAKAEAKAQPSRAEAEESLEGKGRTKENTP